MEDTKDLKHLTERLQHLLKILGGAVGASSLGATIMYAIGFVVVNTSLLRYGAYEHSLLRIEFLAAGISYSVLTLGMVLLGAVAVDWLVRLAQPVLRWRPIQRLLESSKAPRRTVSLLASFFAGALLLLAVSWVTRLFPAGLQWWGKFGRAVIWGYMVALVGGIYVEYLERKGFWQKLTGSAPLLPGGGKPIVWGVGLLLVALISYGGFVYPRLPKSWGGGSPIYVEFVVEEQAIPMLEMLGLRVGSGGLTERVTFLTESPQQILVVTQGGDTVSFDPRLVKASKFYSVSYYVSAELHLKDGDWYREHKQWSNAITEYDAAIRIQASLIEAWIGRGMAYAGMYLESPDQQAYDSAHRNLMQAIRRAEKTEAHRSAALAYYQHGRLCVHYLEYPPEAVKADGAPTIEDFEEDVQHAFEHDPDFFEVIMLEEHFQRWFQREEEEDDTLQETICKAICTAAGEPSSVWLAREYARLGFRCEQDGDLEKAVKFYDLAARVAQRCIEDGEPAAAQYRARKGDVLEDLSSLEDAITEYEEATGLDPEEADYWYRLALLRYEYGNTAEAADEYDTAVKLNPDMIDHRYQFALLSYQSGDLDRAKKECQAVVDPEIERDLDMDTVGCRILLGNVCRDREEPVAARGKYAEAAYQAAVKLGAPSLAADAYYQWARLEAGDEHVEEAIELLEKAVWLDRVCSEEAESEGDFDDLRGLEDYQTAVSPPTVLEIGAHPEERTVSFLLEEPRDDFLEGVNVLTQILETEERVTPDGAGQVESCDSEDQRLYICQLRPDASYTVGELAAALRRLLGLAESAPPPET